MPRYYELGEHRRPVSTSVPEAQRWFDQGWNWTYAFNHEEAVKCFEHAVELDPTCAMAYWGVAYAAGPNYNKSWDQFDEVDLRQTVEKTYRVARDAMQVLDHASPLERALIEALQHRYPSPEPVEDCMVWNDGYADAMREVYREFGDDLDVAALFAEALMNRTPWELWDLHTGEPTEGASTTEATEVLERAFQNPAAWHHPAVLHLYIHLMEMSPHPERALRAGDALRGLVPDGGHLNHMPTHIDVLCGDYVNVVASNSAAIVANRKYFEHEGGMNFYTLYRMHDYHFKAYGAMFLGQYTAAIEAAREMVSTVPEELLRVEVPPMADWIEAFLPIDMHVMIRFGKWQEIIDTPLPEDQELYSYTTAVNHYAKGVAYAATGRVADAQEQRRLFEEAAERVPETRNLQENPCEDILAIAREMLNGELEYRRGNYDIAFAHLRRGIELEDGLNYAEPWGWMQPVRHAYAALLLEQGHVEEAEAVYRADLGFDDTLARAYQHPENVWSLHGYYECLVRLGKHEIAEVIKPRLDLGLARAEVEINASCFCRMNHAA